MNLSQKCQYALRAVFELGKHRGEGPVAASEIAATQAIPVRFLELILRELRQAGYVASRRGVDGGYLATVDPEELTVGEIIRFIDGTLDPVKCLGTNGAETCPLHGACAFMSLWQQAREAVSEVYDNTTFADLIVREQASSELYVLDYNI
ncbi:MAG: Rrf2 family transcriptional regulator [Nitrospiraceae bacterium]|nr:Rrf2 family transcriptional regulator [Nitrospiraceae bacterium]